MTDFSKVKNIIFDFGAVIMDIDIPKAYQSFAALSGKSEEDVRHLFEVQGLYADFESGKLSADIYRNTLRTILELDCPDEFIDMAWCSMLLHIPQERIERIRELSAKYNVYLLSNTNSIHLTAIHEIFLRQHMIRDFTNMFKKAYISFEIGMIKPHPEIYHFVLEDANINKEETIFLDDNKANVDSANGIGLPTIQVIPGSFTMLDILKHA